MSICNMVRGSQEHSDRQQAHLLMPLPTYRWTEGEQPMGRRSRVRRDPETRDLSKAQVPMLKSMDLLQLGMGGFLLCVCVRGRDRGTHALCMNF